MTATTTATAPTAGLILALDLGNYKRVARAAALRSRDHRPRVPAPRRGPRGTAPRPRSGSPGFVGKGRRWADARTTPDAARLHDYGRAALTRRPRVGLADRAG